MESRELRNTVSGNVNLDIRYGKQHGSFSETKIEPASDPTIPPVGVRATEMKSYLQKPLHSRVTAGKFTGAEIHNLSPHQWVDV